MKARKDVPEFADAVLLAADTGKPTFLACYGAIRYYTLGAVAAAAVLYELDGKINAELMDNGVLVTGIDAAEETV